MGRTMTDKKGFAPSWALRRTKRGVLRTKGEGAFRMETQKEAFKLLGRMRVWIGGGGFPWEEVLGVEEGESNSA